MRSLSTQADGLLARARRLLSDHRTRAKRDGVALDYGLADVRQLLAERPLCEYCRMPVAWNASLDHRLPTGRGGKHTLDNLAVVCVRCNGIKGQMTEGEFREVLMLLSQFHPAARADIERRLLAGGQRYAAGIGRRPSA